MTDLVVGTDSTESSDALAGYLRSTVGDGDVVHVVNSLPGGNQTDTEELRAGDQALEALVDALADTGATVERHQFVRGNEPVEDLLAFAAEVDADEFAVGIRKYTPVGKVVFGSTAQKLLLAADRPTRCVPLDEPA